MNFKFESLNIHISHLTKIGMIIVTLKCQKIYIIIWTFKDFQDIFLAPINMFWPWTQKTHSFEGDVHENENDSKTW